MALSIKDEEADRLARKVASLTGETLTQAVISSLRQRLEHEEQAREDDDVTIDYIMEIAHHCATLPELDPRSADEIIGYDEYGLPT